MRQSCKWGRTADEAELQMEQHRRRSRTANETEPQPEQNCKWSRTVTKANLQMEQSPITKSEPQIGRPRELRKPQPRISAHVSFVKAVDGFCRRKSGGNTENNDCSISSIPDRGKNRKQF